MKDALRGELAKAVSHGRNDPLTTSEFERPFDLPRNLPSAAGCPIAVTALAPPGQVYKIGPVSWFAVLFMSDQAGLPDRG